VFHHCGDGIVSRILDSILNVPYIVIKDIDANRRFGNAMNKMHDVIFNHQLVYNVYPQKIAGFLTSRGYKVSVLSIPKLWYPHFLLIAKR